MLDTNCPYCGTEQDINHDDGYGYENDVKHEQQCGNCRKKFVFTTNIVYYYNTMKADCLNDAEHDYKPTITFPREFTQMECKMCGETRRPTELEMIEILK